MTTEGNLALLQASGNVVPMARKIAAESRSQDFYYDPANNPSLTTLHRVTGCFNSIVQVASTYSLDLFHYQLSPPILARILINADLQNFITAQPQPLASEELNALFASGDPGGAHAIAARLEPSDIVFAEDQRITIGYRMDVSMVRILQTNVPPPENLLLFRERTISENVGSLETIARLGNLGLSIETSYSHRSDPISKRLDIFADMATARFTILPPRPGDLKRLFDYFLAPELPRALEALQSQRQISLTPTISLVGRSPVAVPVDEILNFGVSVFHVAKGKKQALVAAFLVLPDSTGYREEVEHFIGGEDYGVISDEYLIERVFMHAWNRGGFCRLLSWSKPSTVAVTDEDGNVSYEDAVIYGRLDLESLESVSIETDSNTRRDHVRLVGTASAAPVGMWV